MSKTQRQQSTKLLLQSLISIWDCPNVYQSQYIPLIKHLCEDIGSIFSLNVYYCLLSDDIDKLLGYDISPSSYEDSMTYYDDNLLLSLIKKYPHWKTSLNPLKKAIETFIQCELECQEHNQRISRSRSTFRKGAVPSVIVIAARKISSILGDVPSISSLPVDFGPGASFLVKGRTTSYDKITGPLDVTIEACDCAVELLQSCPGWLSLHGISPSDTSRIKEMLTILPGSRLSFVPKTAKTHRPINIEPGLNKIIQKGYGSILRDRLKRTGLNLNRCPEIHQQLAKQASIDGSLATVDLSSASDMISWEIVYELLPPMWFDVLDTIRSQRYCYENKWYEFHKFSAMGNGYTFELESLIFYALAYACCKETGSDVSQVSVFGDDIILPSKSYSLLSEVLTYCGFSINKEKSFHSGPFRESCGGDYFHGVSVRGFYIKEELRFRTIVRFRNYLYRTGYRFRYKSLWRFLRNLLRRYNEFLAGPDDGTDDHIIYDNRSFHGRTYNCVTIRSKRRHIPNRWHSYRVWMLFEAQRIEPMTFSQETGKFLVKEGTAAPILSDQFAKQYISISSRYERPSNTEQPFWNPD